MSIHKSKGMIQRGILMKQKQYLTVEALTKYIKRKFDFDPHLQNIYVKGEISNFKRHTSGHMYFTLKDKKARIAAVMFASSARSIRFEPEDGMTVLLHGEITVYEPSGQYQIYVKGMEPEGIGALYLAYEQLKEKLDKEGLFNLQYKKKIPTYPDVVGVITSRTGAAIRDIITTIKRRFPIAKIIIYPALVQGSQAAPSIVQAIKIANERQEADVLIVGRGGGSIEDLWAFNEEIVARAIFSSKIPIISAVGHETDTTIADFVADMRAPTPTGAAELAVPNIKDLLEKILNRKVRLTRATKEKLTFSKERLNRIEKSYAFRYPEKLFVQKMELLDRTINQANRLVNQKILDANQELIHLKQRLKGKKPEAQLKLAQQKMDALYKRLNRVMTTTVNQKNQNFVKQLSTLNALSPLKIMERGYSIAFNHEQKIIKRIHDVNIGESITVRVSDGTLEGKIIEKKKV